MVKYRVVSANLLVVAAVARITAAVLDCVAVGAPVMVLPDTVTLAGKDPDCRA